MSRWFRFYDDALNDPKVQALSPVLFKFWVNLLCVASRNDGLIPPLSELKASLKARSDYVEAHLNELIKLGLIDLSGDRFEPHNWRKRQYKSDISTPRVKRFRSVSKTVSETPPDTDTDTETDSSIVQIADLNATKSARKKRTCDDPLFIEFYSAYPRRQSKQDAIKAYAQVRKSGVAHESIMRGLDRAKRGDRRFRDPQFTPLPASWLRAGGFDDEPDSNQQSAERLAFA